VLAIYSENPLERQLYLKGTQNLGVNVPVRWQYKNTLLDFFSDIFACCVKKQTLNYYANAYAVELREKLFHYYPHYRDFVFSLFVNFVRITSESLRTLVENDLNGSNIEAKSYIRIIFSCSLTNSIFIKRLIVGSTKRRRIKLKINVWYYFKYFSFAQIVKTILRHQLHKSL